MNRLAHWMMRLYPERWRARYGDELDALLRDTGADARVVTDLFRGGMRMQLKAWPFVKLAVTLGVVGVLLGAGLAWLLPSEYMSRATLQITPAVVHDSNTGIPAINQLNDTIQLMETSIMSRSSLSNMILDPRLRLYSDRYGKQPFEDTLGEMRANIRMNFVALPGTLGKRATAFDITFTYPDPVKAQLTVNALVAAFQEQAKGRADFAAKPVNKVLLDVLDAPVFPSSPSYPNPTLLTVGGFVAGVLIAVILRTARGTGLIVKRFVPIAATLGVTGMAAVMTGNTLNVFPYQYRSTATLRLYNTQEQMMAVQDEVLSRTSLSTIVNDPRLRLYEQEQKSIPLEDLLLTMKRHLTIRDDGDRNGQIVSLAFEYPDRYKARMTLDAILSRFDEAETRLYRNVAAGKPLTPMVLDVLDAANLPHAPSKPNRPQIAAAGGIGGVFLASVIAFIRRRWKPEPDFPADAVRG